MKKLIAFSVIMLAACSSAGAFTPATGYSAKELYSTYGTYTLLTGLAADGGKLYFGNYTSILSLDVASGSTASAGTVPHNIETSVVLRDNGTTYVAYGPNYGFSVDYPIGYIDAGGSFVQQTTQVSIYDAAVNSAGDFYLVASPATGQSKVYHYNQANGAMTEVADMGGYSGPLAFDAGDNLYYAHQTSGDVLRFSASAVAAARDGGGILTVDDGAIVANASSVGYMAFGGDGCLYATTDFTTLAKFDALSGARLGDVAYGSSLGKLACDDGKLYVLDTDWTSYYSTLQEVSVPEPATMALLAAGALAVVRRSRRRT